MFTEFACTVTCLERTCDAMIHVTHFLKYSNTYKLFTHWEKLRRICRWNEFNSWHSIKRDEAASQQYFITIESNPREVSYDLFTRSVVTISKGQWFHMPALPEGISFQDQF